MPAAAEATAHAKRVVEGIASANGFFTAEVEAQADPIVLNGVKNLQDIAGNGAEKSVILLFRPAKLRLIPTDWLMT